MNPNKSGSQAIDDGINRCLILLRNYQNMLALYEVIKANEMLKLSPNYDAVCGALIIKGRAIHESLSYAQMDLFSLVHWAPDAE